MLSDSADGVMSGCMDPHHRSSYEGGWMSAGGWMSSGLQKTSSCMTRSDRLSQCVSLQETMCKYLNCYWILKVKEILELLSFRKLFTKHILP